MLVPEIGRIELLNAPPPRLFGERACTICKTSGTNIAAESCSHYNIGLIKIVSSERQNIASKQKLCYSDSSDGEE
uniref:Uncharacterized protein n=1 Tax=Timema cristinae TaxID=61476 RepID=A0A7R9DDV3_TIMCR|nr:unnamed protein product [Timema cristinae]